MTMIVYVQCMDGEKTVRWAANMINFDRGCVTWTCAVAKS